ncbi:MAG: helix-hairpin-helix domain-containing protein, partial [Anaerolineales bacterium]|nr:helix-hairpin-helix domain-containing protein [Anaerolineales bacterium]
EWVQEAARQEAEQPAPPEAQAPPAEAELAEELPEAPPKRLPEEETPTIETAAAAPGIALQPEAEAPAPIVEVEPTAPETTPTEIMEMAPEAEFGGEAMQPAEEAPLPQKDELQLPEELPELPSWLASGLPETGELEWTPPLIHLELNKASMAELERLSGIGFIMAQAIINYREAHGPFQSVEELLKVPNFSQATLEDIRDNLFVAAPEEPPAPQPVEATYLLEEAEIAPELAEARAALAEDNLESALTMYAELINSEQSLSGVISDLHEIAEHHDTDFDVWQNLGDAYLRTNQVAEALRAYIKAEELLR